MIARIVATALLAGALAGCTTLIPVKNAATGEIHYCQGISQFPYGAWQEAHHCADKYEEAGWLRLDHPADMPTPSAKDQGHTE